MLLTGRTPANKRQAMVDRFDDIAKSDIARYLRHAIDAALATPGTVTLPGALLPTD